MNDNRMPLLQLKNIYKSFGGVIALNGAEFSLQKGEIHAIVGENGAGKSTMMNIIGGNIEPSSGDILLGGKKVHFNSAADSQKNNITFIHQELSVFPKLDVMTNIFIEQFAQMKKLSLLQKKNYIKKTKEILKKIALDISPLSSLSKLGMGQRQMIEISRMFTRDTKILVLDEPTSSLTDKEIEILFSFIRELSKEGVAIIYISHKLEEIFEISDRITVLRDGETVGTFKTDQLDQRKLIELMIGNEIKDRFPVKTHSISDEKVLQICNFSSPDVFNSLCVDLYRGEVLGLTGLLGAGRTEFARALFGMDRHAKGEVVIKGNKIKFVSPRTAIKNGIGFVTENRREEGLVISNAIKDNVVMANLDRYKKGRFVFNKKKQMEDSKRIMGQLRIKADSINQIVNNLSGGNQQKVVLGKWINNNPDILVLDEPTRGIDIGAKHEIYKLIDELAHQGMSIIFISSEIPEILGVCDTVMVMHKGSISKKINIKETKQSDLMLMVQGGI